MSAPQRPLRVLIVDDNTWMQRILAKIVSSYGWQPTIAADGYEAIAKALESTPDVAIVDLIMPDLSGLQVLRLLRRLPQTSHVPVLIVSVATEAELLMEALESGAAGFIRKPFTRATVYDSIVRALEPPAEPTPEPEAASPPTAATTESQPSTPAPRTAGASLERYRQLTAPPDEEQLRRLLDSL